MEKEVREMNQDKLEAYVNLYDNAAALEEALQILPGE